jgi:hypothetical protein
VRQLNFDLTIKYEISVKHQAQQVLELQLWLMQMPTLSILQLPKLGPMLKVATVILATIECVK